VLLFESALRRRRRVRDQGRIRQSHARGAARIRCRGTGCRRRGIFVLDGMLALNELSELVSLDRPDLKFKPYNPRFPERVRDNGGDCFLAINKRISSSITLMNPLMSCPIPEPGGGRSQCRRDQADAVSHLLRQSDRACLIEAAEAGKVGDRPRRTQGALRRGANIRWARDLERAGAQVCLASSN